MTAKTFDDKMKDGTKKAGKDLKKAGRDIKKAGRNLKHDIAKTGSKIKRKLKL